MRYVPATVPPIDELDRAFILLPSDATIHSGAHGIAVAFDRDPDGNPTPTVLGYDDNPSFLAAYQLTDVLCGDRAQRTVDGTLTVCGQRITPEKYLKLWRQTVAKPLSAEQFAHRYGRRPMARFDAPLRPSRGRKRNLSTSPWETFDQFEIAYASKIRPYQDAERFRLEIDLSEPEGPKRAYYLYDLLPHNHPDLPDATRLEIAIVPLNAPPAEPIPQEGWRDHLFRARVYAGELGVQWEADWTPGRIAEAVDAHLAARALAADQAPRLRSTNQLGPNLDLFALPAA